MYSNNNNNNDVLDNERGFKSRKRSSNKESQANNEREKRTPSEVTR